MQMGRVSTAALAAAMMLAAGAAGAQSTDRGTQEIPAESAKVTGTIVIDFNSRSESASSGADVYTLDALTVADLFIYSGTIQRTPEEEISYSVKIDVFNPANPSQIAREVAILRGAMAIDESGRYLPEEGDLRIDIVKGQQSTSNFTGVIQGREVTRWWELDEQLERAEDIATKLYSRTVDGKVVTIQVQNPDPLSFQNVGLAAGPFSFLPQARVNGDLDYDYELGNWLTDNNGLTFQYTLGETVVSDKVGGSIRFVEEEGTFTDSNGKTRSYTGYYEYNLRFNEATVAPEEAFFGENTEAEFDAFFSEAAADVPGLYGRVYYYDTEDGCERVVVDNAMECVGPTRSEVTYELRAVKLTYAQLGNWFKLEPLIVGPFNDE
jgi:hypothetical protein